MNRLTLASALAVALTSSAPGEAGQVAGIPAMTEEDAAEILKLQEDYHNRYTIPVTIDGAGPFDFMIDTGSQATAITDRVHNQLELEPSGTALIVGTASQQVVDTVEVGSLEIGERTIRNFSAPVLSRANVGADGILGLDSLQDMRVLIDFRNETIAVADAPSTQSTRGYEIIVRARQKLGQLLITNADIDGVRTVVIVDTGAQGSLGNLALLEKLRERHAERVLATDVNGAVLVGKMAIADSLTIQDMTFSNVAITYADTPAFEALGLKGVPALSLGMESLRLFDRVAIDFSRQRVMFDLPKSARIQSKLRKGNASRLKS